MRGCRETSREAHKICESRSWKGRDSAYLRRRKHRYLLGFCEPDEGWAKQTSQRRTLFMAAKKTGKTPATVTLKHIAAKIAEDHEIAKKQSEAILGDTVALVVKHLKG